MGSRGWLLLGLGAIAAALLGLLVWNAVDHWARRPQLADARARVDTSPPPAVDDEPARPETADTAPTPDPADAVAPQVAARPPEPVPQPAEPAPPLAIGLPVDCQPGVTCWIAKYVDHDPGKGVRDYACGQMANDGHNGTDFALRDMASMASGVAVLAVADGRVVGVRDGMPDAEPGEEKWRSVKGRECGNGVRIDHGGGWAAQYCHMKQGTPRVHVGDAVRKGQPLGEIGISGLSAFPHVHLSIWHGKRLVDPFVGLGAKPDCGPGAAPLWEPAVAARLAYDGALPMNAGFVAQADALKRPRGDRPSREELPGDAPSIVFWVEGLGVAPGDQVTMRLVGPDGGALGERSWRIEQHSVLPFYYIERPRRGAAWQPGTYLGEVTFRRESGPGAGENSVARELRIR